MHIYGHYIIINNEILYIFKLNDYGKITKSVIYVKFFISRYIFYT